MLCPPQLHPRRQDSQRPWPRCGNEPLLWTVFPVSLSELHMVLDCKTLTPLDGALGGGAGMSDLSPCTFGNSSPGGFRNVPLLTRAHTGHGVRLLILEGGDHGGRRSFQRPRHGTWPVATGLGQGLPLGVLIKQGGGGWTPCPWVMLRVGAPRGYTLGAQVQKSPPPAGPHPADAVQWHGAEEGRTEGKSSPPCSGAGQPVAGPCSRGTRE